MLIDFGFLNVKEKINWYDWKGSIMKINGNNDFILKSDTKLKFCQKEKEKIMITK